MASMYPTQGNKTSKAKMGPAMRGVMRDPVAPPRGGISRGPAIPPVREVAQPNYPNPDIKPNPAGQALDDLESAYRAPKGAQPQQPAKQVPQTVPTLRQSPAQAMQSRAAEDPHLSGALDDMEAQYAPQYARSQPASKPGAGSGSGQPSLPPGSHQYDLGTPGPSQPPAPSGAYGSDAVDFSDLFETPDAPATSAPELGYVGYDEEGGYWAPDGTYYPPGYSTGAPELYEAETGQAAEAVDYGLDEDGWPLDANGEKIPLDDLPDNFLENWWKDQAEKAAGGGTDGSADDESSGMPTPDEYNAVPAGGVTFDDGSTGTYRVADVHAPARDERGGGEVTASETADTGTGGDYQSLIDELLADDPGIDDEDKQAAIDSLWHMNQKAKMQQADALALAGIGGTGSAAVNMGDIDASTLAELGNLEFQTALAKEQSETARLGMLVNAQAGKDALAQNAEQFLLDHGLKKAQVDAFLKDADEADAFQASENYAAALKAEKWNKDAWLAFIAAYTDGGLDAVAALDFYVDPSGVIQMTKKPEPGKASAYPDPPYPDWDAQQEKAKAAGSDKAKKWADMSEEERKAAHDAWKSATGQG